jgi:hypothetical protein
MRAQVPATEYVGAGQADSGGGLENRRLSLRWLEFNLPPLHKTPLNGALQSGVVLIQSGCVRLPVVVC